MDAETLIVKIIVPVALALLSMVTTGAFAIAGFVIRMLFTRIDQARQEAKTLVVEEETRRNQAIAAVQSEQSKGFEELKVELRIIRDDIKNISN